MDMDENHPWVKQQMKQAQVKSIFFAAIITALFVVLTFSHLDYFWCAFCFLFTRSIAFVLFARSVWKYLEPYEPQGDDDMAIDGVNANNGYPSGVGYILPTPLSRQ